MHLFARRDVLPYPAGLNSSDTVLGGVHLNLTVLELFNYTLYFNDTVSNGSNCYVTTPRFAPAALLENGTFVNSTWCYDPIRHIGPRAKAAVGVAIPFTLACLLIMVCLKKHARLYLPTTKRFYPVGKRWQWYYAILVCATAFIGLFTAIDVDRFWVVGLPIILNSFFWYLMQSCAMALVWEAVRHWGSWSERQFIDPDPFTLREGDKRSMFELWLPLWYYLWLWLNFFLVIPRNWGEIEKQRSPDQTAAHAAPSATDGRFKAAAFCFVICWLTILVSLRHSINHYYPRNRGPVNRTRGFIKYTPWRFIFIIPLAACIVAYQALVSFRWDYSLLNTQAPLTAVFIGGYGPTLAILFVQIVYGLRSPNEDKELIRQRRVRGAEIDRDMGIVAKPAWWKRLNRDDHLVGKMNMRDRIARNVREVGGGRATAAGVQQNINAQVDERQPSDRDIEMASMTDDSSSPRPVPPGFDAAKGASVSSYGGKSDRRRQERTVNAAAELLFPSIGASRADRSAELMQDGPPPSYTDTPTLGQGRGRRPESTTSTLSPGDRSNSASTAVSVSGQQPQQVRSMLDV